ncbi:MAG: hypothetical protein CENE_00989 [Candidatus Celerinatantimonas neptuna]|nr:MAG: hypothetical protein CENE_00989 [Candidatus Celerinatantimonas neptuna]
MMLGHWKLLQTSKFIVKQKRQQTLFAPMIEASQKPIICLWKNEPPHIKEHLSLRIEYATNTPDRSLFFIP